ncbi:MAG: Lrp/AsnC family transcriptional regulator [Actinomycetota bacterium]
MADPRLDELDTGILEQLQVDGRMPFSRIAEELGVSDATVRARVNRMERGRLVKFVIDVDAANLGLIEVYLGLQVQGPALDRVIEAIADIPEIPYAAECSGVFDILCELICRDNDDLLRVLREIRRVPGIARVETLTVLKIRKDTWRYAALAQRSSERRRTTDARS